jgi:hypothetical protein
MYMNKVIARRAEKEKAAKQELSSVSPSSEKQQPQQRQPEDAGSLSTVETTPQHVPGSSSAEGSG